MRASEPQFVLVLTAQVFFFFSQANRLLSLVLPEKLNEIRITFDLQFITSPQLILIKFLGGKSPGKPGF